MCVRKSTAPIRTNKPIISTVQLAIPKIFKVPFITLIPNIFCEYEPQKCIYWVKYNNILKKGDVIPIAEQIIPAINLTLK
jgi:hypothetical protein